MSNWTLRLEQLQALPVLGWIARVPLRGGTVSLLHCKGVETSANWVADGVWCESFKEGNFHFEECFFGRGIRLIQKTVHFCASLAMVDRLMDAQLAGGVVVFGSGGRQLGEHTIFVSSGTTLDRLQWVERDSRTYASNSTVALYRLANVEFEPSIMEFLDVFPSIANSIIKLDYPILLLGETHARHATGECCHTDL